MLEILLIFIQNVGMKIRKDEPKILKDLIILVNESFNKYKAEHTTTASDEKI